MKAKLKTASRAITFLAIFLALFIGLNQLMQPEWLEWNNYFTVHGFYEEPENTIETVFLGPSSILSAVIPTQLYRDYGICAYNLATEQQPMLASYYWLEEAYRLHGDTLKTAVLEVAMIRKDAESAFYHKAFDAMKLSDVKLRAARAYGASDERGNSINMLLPLMSYHSRWNELDATDFKSSRDPVNGIRGYCYSPNTQFDLSAFDGTGSIKYALDEEAAPVEFYPEAVHYLDKINSFCQEHNIKLVLMRTPAWGWNSGEHHAIQSLADQYGADFIDLCFGDWHEEHDFLLTLDSSDGQHVNYFGANKITDYLGQYLTENCGATDVRGNAAYSHMEDQLCTYELDYAQPDSLNSAPDITSYLQKACSEENTVFLAVQSEAAAALTSAQREYFRSIGLTKLANLNSAECYLGIVEHGNVIYEDIKTHEAINADQTALAYTGTLQNGETFTVKSGKYIAACIISDKHRLANVDGLNVVVYNQEYRKVLDSTCFDTNVESWREVYGVDTVEMIKNVPNREMIKSHSLYYHLDRILNAETNELALNLQKMLAGNLDNPFRILDYYLKDENNIVYISASDDAATCLTDEARVLLADYGLPMLAQLEFRQPYIGVFGSGSVWHEQIGRTDEALEYVNGEIRVQSAGMEAGAHSAVWINGVNCSPNQRGLNIVVYNTESRDVLYQVAFDTYAEPLKLASDSYADTETNDLLLSLRKMLADSLDSPFRILDHYLKDENNIVYISVSDEAATSLTDEARALLADYGLPMLAQLEYRQPYIGILSAGSMRYEQLGRADEMLEYANGKIRIQSAGMEAGARSAIWINGVDYSLNQRGLNIVVYNTENKAMMHQAAFDTCAEPLNLPQNN